jgi:hypothetical protein
MGWIQLAAQTGFGQPGALDLESLACNVPASSLEEKQQVPQRKPSYCIPKGEVSWIAVHS